MTVLMAVVEWLCASAGKHPDTILIVKCLVLLIIDLEELEHLSLELSTGEERDPSRHLMFRKVSWTALRRIQVSARDK
jgi:hypothetical protein